MKHALTEKFLRRAATAVQKKDSDPVSGINTTVGGSFIRFYLAGRMVCEAHRTAQRHDMFTGSHQTFGELSLFALPVQDCSQNLVRWLG